MFDRVFQEGPLASLLIKGERTLDVALLLVLQLGIVRFRLRHIERKVCSSHYGGPMHVRLLHLSHDRSTQRLLLYRGKRIPQVKGFRRQSVLNEYVAQNATDFKRSLHAGRLGTAAAAETFRLNLSFHLVSQLFCDPLVYHLGRVGRVRCPGEL